MKRMLQTTSGSLDLVAIGTNPVSREITEPRLTIPTETPDGKPILVAGRDHVVVGKPESREIILKTVVEIKA